MRALRVLRLRLRSLLRRRRVDEELESELRDHLERQIERHRAAGLTEVEARRAALREFGNLPLVKEQCHDARRLNWIDDVGRDVRYAFRSMRRAPGSTAAAILSLALAIGANTAIFTLVNALMLRELPVSRPQELVELGRLSEYGRGNFSYPMYEYFRDDRTVLGGVLAMSSGTVEASVPDLSPQPTGRYVSADFFEALGASPSVGRLFAAAPHSVNRADAAMATVISDTLWRRAFARDPHVVGRTLTIDHFAFTIIGVLPPDFTGLIAGRPDEFYVSMASEPLLHRPSWLQKRAYNWLTIVGRLKPGISPARAKANLDLVFARCLDEYASGMTDADARRRIRAHRLVIESARTGLSASRREFSQPVLLLMGAVTLVLLIASANVLNLLLARGTARGREIRLRLAIGASRGRLVRQLLTESAVLGLAGGGIGLALAVRGARAIISIVADCDPGISFDAGPDARVLAFTALISLGSAFLAGVVPAVRLSRTDVRPDDDGSERSLGATPSITLWNRALVVTQVALSLLLLTGASLLMTSLHHLRTFDTGFDRKNVLVVGLNPVKAGYEGGRLLTYYRQVLERVRGINGVRAAGLSLITPISGGGVDLSFAVEGRPREPGAMVYVNEISDGYFAAMGTPLILGREFSPTDGPASPPVVVINDALSRRYFEGVNPIGRRVRLGNQDGLEIVGVVATAKYLSLREDQQPTIYLPALQKAAQAWDLTLAVRTSGAPSAMRPAVRREIQAVAPTLPIGDDSTLSARIDRSLLKERLMTRVLAAFAGLAILLASVGMYGVLGCAVTRRTNEFGVRLALGARPADVLSSVLWESCALVGIGVTIGVPAALALTRLLTSVLYNVRPTDPLALGGAAACLFLVAFAAALQPAWRASHVDPLVALRHE